MRPAVPLGWSGIARIGLIQAAMGAIVVLTTSLLNRVMVVELGLAASVPGALVGLHYALQLLRPRWGHGADAASRRSPWILGGMAVLATGGILAATGTATIADHRALGLGLTIGGFGLIGIGVGAAGTALLTLLADSVTAERRPAAASVVWIMMIAGFIVTTAVASSLLAPFSYGRLVRLSAGVCIIAFLVAALALHGLERSRGAVDAGPARPTFRIALAQVWADAQARRFTVFVAVSMLAYSMQDLILEPFAGLTFAMSPAETTALTSLQSSGTLVGMLGVAAAGRRLGGGRAEGMRRLTAAGCVVSAVALVLIALAGSMEAVAVIRPAIAVLGLGNGIFAVSAIGLMMTLAGSEGTGVRMGVWGAAQAVAFGSGGMIGAVAVDLVRVASGSTTPAYISVFAVEAALFVWAASMMRAATRDESRQVVTEGQAWPIST